MANDKKEIKIELPPEVASGHYSNFAVISHSPNEFFLDFITVAPNMPQARVQSRVIMTPENFKNLLFAIRENVQRYESNFGEIRHKQPANGGNGNGGSDIPNPFQA